MILRHIPLVVRSFSLSRLLRRKWKLPRVYVSLIVLELVGIIASLALFSIAQPNLFRTRLWKVGADHGFNSNPAQILYAYANHRPIPRIPFVWTETLTNYNVAVSVLSMFMLLVKVIMFVIRIWYPLVAGLISALLIILWIVSLYGQMGPDYSDTQHPSPLAWYVAHSCEVARPSGNHHYCLLAQSTFVVTVFMCLVYMLNTILAFYSLVPPSKTQLLSQQNQCQDPLNGATTIATPNGNGSDCHIHTDHNDPQRDWEMIDFSKAFNPSSLYSPRTLAFHTLDGQIPSVTHDS